nr:RHS repeat-associated core domain-containing protein [Gammaproteobacteria bacterium]
TDDPRHGFNNGNHGTPNQGNAPHLTTGYWERYEYDPAGNMTALKHSRNGTPAWTRYFGMAGFTPADWEQEWPQHFGSAAAWSNAPGNQLTHVGDDTPNLLQTHFFDPSGNLIRENTERHFTWNYSDQMREFRVQAGSGNPSVEAHYLYDAGGQRVKKVVRRGRNFDTTTYIDELFEDHRWDHGSGRGAHNWLHVMDDKQRIALVRRGAARPDDSSPAVQFHLGDHLGNSSIVVGNLGQWINREEYFPHGETNFGSYGKKRFRFMGKERDEESGLIYVSARAYAPWMSKWISCDPAERSSGLNLYQHVSNNPLGFIDPDGKQERPITDADGTMGPLAAHTDTSETQRKARNLADNIRSGAVNTGSQINLQAKLGERRWKIMQFAKQQNSLLESGKISSVEALARVVDYTAQFHVDEGSILDKEDEETFIDDLGIVLAGRTGQFLKRTGLPIVNLGDVGFREKYREPQFPKSPQTRHFIGSVMAGYYWSRVLSSGAVVLAELYPWLQSQPEATWADVQLGIAGSKLGVLLRDDIVMERVSILEAGDWIRKEVGKSPLRRAGEAFKLARFPKSPAIPNEVKLPGQAQPIR